MAVKPRFANKKERQQHLEMMWQQRLLRGAGSLALKKQVAPALGSQEQRASKNAKITVYHFSKKKHQWQKTKEKIISFS